MVLATKAKVAAAAAILLFAGAFAWRWTHPPEARPEPDRADGARSAGSMVAAAPAGQAAVQDAAAPTRRIVARRVAEPEDRSGSGNTRIVGEIVEDDTGKPLEGAEVSLSRAADGGLIARTLTEADGSFALPASSMIAGRPPSPPGVPCPRRPRGNGRPSGSRSPRAIACAGKYPSSDWRDGPGHA